jgi:putative AlgH/UPF0301 family transcriptional regulator
VDGIGALFPSSSYATQTVSEENPSAAATTLLQSMTPLDPWQWAYDSGHIIEKGAIILGGVEQKFVFGLQQQHVHKAAILVLDHDANRLTKGIVLNRPTDLTLDDDINPGIKWRVWFGGDVDTFDWEKPEVVCIHSLQNDQVFQVSTTVMKDICWTTFEAAKRLGKAGVAKPSDFWVFVGYAGWGPGQLLEELGRKSWYMVATDSQTLLKELARQTSGADPRDAGLYTWALLMTMIGRSVTATERTGGFDDVVTHRRIRSIYCHGDRRPRR